MVKDVTSDNYEEKSPEEVKRITQKGSKYYCAECNSELVVKKPCPICKTEIDWDRITGEARPY